MNAPNNGLAVARLSGELGAVMGGIVSHLMELPGADGASLSTVDGERAHFSVCEGEDRALLGRTLHLDETLGGECLTRGEVTVLRAGSGPEVTRCLTPGAGAIVMAPIAYDGRIRGILGVRSASQDAFDEADVEAIRALADGAGIALRNAEVVQRLADSERSYRALHEEAVRDVNERKENEDRLRSNLGRLHAIVATQQEMSALELDPEAVTATIVERAQRLAGGDGAAVQWFDGFESVFAQAAGIAAPHVGLRLDRGASLAGIAAMTGEVVYSADTATDPRVDREAVEKLGARSLICAPLVRGGAPVGVLAVMAERPDAFDALAVETTRLMAEFVSTVIRNANELEERRQLAAQLRLQGEVVEHMQTALWIWAPHGDGFRLEYANQASEQATGLPAGEVVGRSLVEIVPGLAPTLEEMLLRVDSTHEQVVIEELEYGDERIRPGVFSARAFPLPEGRVAVAFENVTEIARAQRALRESEARFRGAFDSASVGMALATLDGAFVEVNDRFGEMLGYLPEELTRLAIEDVTHPDELETDVGLTRELRSGVRDAYTREKRYLRKDGSTLWAFLAVSVVRGYDGSPTHLVAHVQDIGAQRDTSILFAATFERSVVPTLVADDERRIVSLNEAAAELIGLTVDESLGLRLDDLIPEEQVARRWPVFVEAGRMEAEATLHRPDGGRRRIEFVATADILPQRHIAVIRDLTRQKELEAQLRQAQKMEAVGRLAGGIAHDFNNLLTAIAGYSEFLIMGLDGEERLRRHAEEIKKASDRAAALTGQLLAFSRRQVLQPRVLDLNAVVTDMDMMLRRLIGEDVELITVLEPQLGSVQADPTQVEQVIVNLAVNARDAMPQGGSVTIETTNTERDGHPFVELRLTDTGIGMSEAERRQLFDPFFTTKEGGTGLGLATVYGIVEQSGGTIDVDSWPGLGSSFRILLRRVERAAELPAAPRAPKQRVEGHETVLLVEDELVVRRLVGEILESSGYTVLQAADGPSALELLRRHPGEVALLVTDVVMPGMSGPEVAKAVTSMRPGTQVLYISGYTDSAIGHHGVLEPGIAFLQKPFSADELNRKARALLDGVAVAVE